MFHMLGMSHGWSLTCPLSSCSWICVGSAALLSLACKAPDRTARSPRFGIRSRGCLKAWYGLVADRAR